MQERSRDRTIPVVCIAGTHSGCGKTTISAGIMSAMVRRGYNVQAYKIGPDFIDPGHHRRATGRDAHNLDGWMMDRQMNTDIFLRNLHGADTAVVEGVMGLFDGFSGNTDSGSTAQMAKWLGLPVILVIDARSMARSAAAVALGYSRFDPKVSIRGVLFNRVGSKAHGEMLREAMLELPDLEVYGFLPAEKKLEIPSRHLGLLTEGDFTPGEEFLRDLASWVEENIDLNRLLSSTNSRVTVADEIPPKGNPSIRVAIAVDEAFCFYYEENLRLLRDAGAELVPFSPIRSGMLPEDIQGLILGGGYPELHCIQLSKNKGLLSAIRTFGLEGRPIYAECGGFMYLMEQIADLEGEKHSMVGLFPMDARMEKGLHSLGYRQILTKKRSPLGPAGIKVRGHEFHYSKIAEDHDNVERIYSIQDRKEAGMHEEGYLRKNVLGSYVHLHWGSNPDVAGHFVDCCRKYG